MTQNPRSTKLPDRHTNIMCGTMISGPGLMSYRCDRPIGHMEYPEGDPQPHYAPEVARSVIQWQEWRWRQDHPAEQPYVATAPGARVSEEIPHPALVDTAFDPEAHTDDAQQAIDDAESIPCPVHPQYLTSPHTPCPECVLEGTEISTRSTEDTWAMAGTPISMTGEEPLVPTKQRPGDQRLPDGGGQCVQDLVIAEMEASKRVGLERYGSTLRTFNGRRGIQDVAEEIRDLHVYIKAIEAESAAHRTDLINVVSQAFRVADGDHTLGAAALAEIAVDRIMGWVTGQIIGNGTGLSDEILTSLVIDGIHEGIHSEASWGEVADHIVGKIRREREPRDG